MFLFDFNSEMFVEWLLTPVFFSTLSSSGDTHQFNVIIVPILIAELFFFYRDPIFCDQVLSCVLGG